MVGNITLFNLKCHLVRKLIQIFFRHPPLPGHTLVDEGFAVGEEGGELGLDVGADQSKLYIYIINFPDCFLLSFN